MTQVAVILTMHVCRRQGLVRDVSPTEGAT